MPAFFLVRTNLILRNILITPKFVKMVITDLDSSKASGPDSTPVVVLKNYRSEFSYMLAEFFDMCLKESFYPGYGKVSPVVIVFENVGERSMAKNYHPSGLLSVVSKIFEKLVYNRLVDHFEKYLFSVFEYVSRSSRSTVDLLRVYLIELFGLLLGLGIPEL